MYTYRDLYELILDIYWEQLERIANIIERKMYEKGAPFKACTITISKTNMTASHMCSIAYDLIGGEKL